MNREMVAHKKSVEAAAATDAVKQSIDLGDGLIEGGRGCRYAVGGVDQRGPWSDRMWSMP